MEKISRREFLVGAAAAGLSLTLHQKLPYLTRKVPAVLRAGTIPTNRVVHTHSNHATNWDFTTGWYGDSVDQVVVDRMTDLGVMDLTGVSTLEEAWRSIIPFYSAGQIVAIKINLNNATCTSSGQIIDALPQPVNSVIRGLKTIGVLEENIRVYDVTHGGHEGQMPARVKTKIAAMYPNVQFYAYSGVCSTELGYSATEKVHFIPPPGRSITDRPICNALVGADYLINMPIMKKHVMAGVTLGFKNHFGSIERCDYVHWSIKLADGLYLSTYSGLVDINNNTHIKGKTVLTIGDGLFGGQTNQSEKPRRWPSFGNQSPNSLFFSKDPVAIDCIMYDFLEAEGGVATGADDYLKLASASGLGTFEHRDTAQEYHSIDSRRLEVDLLPRSYLPLTNAGY